ncbi:glutamine synthetase [Pandoraea pulmonicola]|uniref:Glutamine synthetase n=1 Tax=Pandoraea pulmonicola TaxID=93221 RepID=A0ABM5RYW4_PANPU|nr:glutamine synthetase [Pandoraea pulmonicola]
MTSVKIGVTDLDGILRGKYVSLDKALSAVTDKLGFCNVIFGWDVADSPYGNIGHKGYPDAGVRLDSRTLRRVPWDDQVPFVLGEFLQSDGTAHPLCPRQVLRRVLDRAQQTGLTVICGVEFEWFNFSETPQSWNEKKGVDPQPITPGMFGYSLLRTQANSAYIQTLLSEMRAFRIPIEGLHTETGPGVYEVALAYGVALETADRAVLFKAGVKEIAHRFGIMPSFMAKWNSRLPGCSGHIHQSLIDGTSNVFYDRRRSHGMSRLLESYVAGQLRYMGEFGPLYWPNVNSYKRLVDGFWAPTTATWGIDDRTASLRVIPAGASSTRLETRCPGADANPYLSIAAAVASGMAGIEEGLSLVDGHASREMLDRNPRTLMDAVERMRGSSIAREWLGEPFVEHFCSTREWEYEQSLTSVTDWELKRYLEII